MQGFTPDPVDKYSPPCNVGLVDFNALNIALHWLMAISIYVYAFPSLWKAIVVSVICECNESEAD